MNKTWITTLSIAGVVGSGAAAALAASATISHGVPATANAAPAVTVASPSRTIMYQVGTAGSVTVVKDAVGLTITDTTVGTGWTLVGTSVVGPTVSAQFSNGTQIATFDASLAGSEIAVEVSSMALPPAEVAVPVGQVVVLSDSSSVRTSAVPEIGPAVVVPTAASLPLPAPAPSATIPAATTPSAVTSQVTPPTPVNTQAKPVATPVSTPTTAHTTSPSAAGGVESEDEGHDDEGSDVEDHSSDHEGSDHEGSDNEGSDNEDGGDDD